MKVALALLSSLLTAATPHAAASSYDLIPVTQVCSVEKVAGTYGFTASGTILPGNTSGLPAGPAVATGLLILDAYGHMQGVETISFNGTIASDVKFEGTYTVNPDCTFTAEDPGFFHNYGVVVANANELLVINTDNGMVLTLDAKRIQQK